LRVFFKPPNLFVHGMESVCEMKKQRIMETTKTTPPKKKGKVRPAEQGKAGEVKEMEYSNRWKVIFANAGTGKILDMKAVLK